MNAGATKILAVAVVAVLVVGAVVGVILINNNNNSKDKYANWDEVLKEAKGATVSIGQYPDTYLLNYYRDYIIPQAKELGITIDLQAAKYGDYGATDVLTNGKDGVDAFWGPATAYQRLVSEKSENYSRMGEWVSLMPNSQYLTDDQYEQLQYTYKVSTGKDGKEAYASAMPLSSGFTALTYNQTVNAVDAYVYYNVEEGKYVTTSPMHKNLGYNEVAIAKYVCISGGTSPVYDYRIIGTICVAADGTAGAIAFDPADIKFIEAGGEKTTYTISSVHTALETLGTKSGGHELTGMYGLPQNFTELYEWVKIYDHMFTYIDPSSTYAWFHGYMFIQSIMYELTWNADKSGWTTVKAAEDAGETEWEKAGKSYREWLDAKIAELNPKMDVLVTGDDTDYYNLVGYAYKYLKDIEPYCSTLTANHNYASINGLSGQMVQDTANWVSGTNVMLSFSSVGSISMRLGTTTGISSSYNNITPGIYMLDTAVMDQYYFFFNVYSENYAATLVVLNLFLDPVNQMNWYKCNGNLFNIGTDKTFKDANGNQKTVGDEMDLIEARWDGVNDTIAGKLPTCVSHTYIGYRECFDKTVTSNMTVYLPHLQYSWDRYIKNGGDLPA